MGITSDDIKILTSLVGRFENGSEPYQGATGNFDGQGISCGVLQWNIGQQSLQPMIREAGEQTVLSAMPQFGRAMWKACNASIQQGLAIVATWQTNNVLLSAPKKELRAMMGSPKLRELQDTRIRKVAETAEAYAAKWATARTGGGRTRQELVFFFDVVTQNGSMKDLGFADVRAFKAAAGTDRADDLVCDWLARLNANSWGHKDAHKNAALWRGKASGAELDLLVLAYLRSQKSTFRARGDVLNRKGTIAMRRGNVHGTLYDLADLF